MRTGRTLFCLLLCIGMAPMAVAAIPAIQCPSLGRPSGMRLSWVGPRMTVDGLPMAVLRFTSPTPAGAVRAWYWRHWRRFGGHPILYKVAQWQVIARYRGACLETVQVAPYGLGSHGFVGLSEPAALTASGPQSLDFPTPAGSKLLLTLKSNDLGKRAETFVTLIPYGVDAPFYYRHVLAHDGWALQVDRAQSGTGGLIFQKGGTVADLSFTPISGGMTSALVSIVHH